MKKYKKEKERRRTDPTLRHAGHIQGRCEVNLSSPSGLRREFTHVMMRCVSTTRDTNPDRRCANEAFGTVREGERGE